VRNGLFRQPRARFPRGATRSEHFASMAAAKARARSRPIAAGARPCQQACRPGVRRQRRNSDLSKALAALGAARSDDCTATTALHSDEKTVGAGTAGLGRLVGALHGSSSGSVGFARDSAVHGTRFARPRISLCMGQRALGRLTLPAQTGQFTGRCSGVARVAARRWLPGLPRALEVTARAHLAARQPVASRNQGNPRLEQKHPYRSNTCTTACGFAGGLTVVVELWITAASRAEGAYNPAAHRRTCPQ
jgi:hypothetical protein